MDTIAGRPKWTSINKKCEKCGGDMVQIKPNSYICNNKWIYNFKSDFAFQEGDLLIGLGPKETVEQWRRHVNPEKFREE